MKEEEKNVLKRRKSAAIKHIMQLVQLTRGSDEPEKHINTFKIILFDRKKKNIFSCCWNLGKLFNHRLVRLSCSFVLFHCNSLAFTLIRNLWVFFFFSIFWFFVCWFMCYRFNAKRWNVSACNRTSIRRKIIDKNITLFNCHLE